MATQTLSLSISSLELDLQIASSANDLPNRRDFQAWAQAVFADRTQPVELLVRIVDRAESQELNRAYRGMDRPTNVLSFPFEAPPGVPVILVGDLVVCAPVVAAEAAEQGKPVAAHWAHMVVHGALHLCGYDHDTDENAVVMETREREILDQLGFPDPYETDIE